MEQNTYSWLKEQKSQLINIAERQIDVNRKINLDEQNAGKLVGVIERLSLEDFKVMVMGAFSSGKSTFINALLGKTVLPAKMLPSTATICEIRFAETIRCTLFPKEGRYVDKLSGIVRNGPFEIEVGDLKHYILIDHETDGSQTMEDDLKLNPDKSSPFDRMVLEWPLGICKEGVEIIDSPGLNDPDSHDKIALEYLPKTDAIIYCMSCAHSFTNLDKETIENLVAMGYRSIIFILTNYDLIQDTDEESGFVKRTINKLGKYTDLGTEGILFVNSKGGVEGKERGNPEKLIKSNIPLVEKKVEEHLVNQKGKAKLFRGESEIKYQNRITGEFIDNRLKLNSLGLEELVIKYEQLKLLLNSAKGKSDLMLKTLELGIVDITSSAADLERLFLDSIGDRIEGWINDFTPSTPISLIPWKLKPSIKSNVDEYIAHVKYKLKEESILWANEILIPMITKAIKKISSDTAELEQSYEKLMKTFQVEMDFGGIASTQDESKYDSASKWTALLYGLFTGDVFGASLGYTFGFRGLLSSLVAQISAAVIVGIIAMFTPVGMVGVLIAAIVAAIAAGAWNFNMIPNKVKETIIKKMRASLGDREMKDKMILNLQAKIRGEFSRVVEEAKEMFKNDINPKEKAMNDALSVKEKGEKEVMIENKKLLDAKEANELIQKDIAGFGITINI